MNIELRDSPIHGLGVFAKAPIEEGDWQYIYGILIPKPSLYGFDNEDGTFWEPFPPFRYLNHSNTPNCDVTSWDDGTVTLMALRGIEADEELTIDYGYDPSDDSED